MNLTDIFYQKARDSLGAIYFPVSSLFNCLFFAFFFSFVLIYLLASVTPNGFSVVKRKLYNEG